jgi:hypothetical protein
MSGRILAALSLIALLALAGCGGGGGASYGTTSSTEPTATTQTTETTPPETTSLRVYFLLNGKVQPVSRNVPKTRLVLAASIAELLAGPTTTERELGMTTEATKCYVESASALGSTWTLFIPGKCGGAGLAQVVYTATQFPTVKAVQIGGKRYTRSDFEENTPIILVESPLPYEKVANPFRVTGTANTFEATFQYEVVDPDGNVVANDFVTATSGSGQRGTFDFVTKPFDSPPGTGALVVFEYSAKDGSRIHEMRIPVQLPG